MLTTNLLPANDKKTITLVKTARLMRVAAFATTSLLIANAVFLLPTFLPLLFERRELKRELSTGKEAREKFQTNTRFQEMKKLSAAVKETRSHISRPQYTSRILDAIVEHGVAGIAVETITVTETGAISITGRAATRKALIDFEEKFKASEYMENISSPLSNIIRESNISFTMQGNLKPAILEKAK